MILRIPTITILQYPINISNIISTLKYRNYNQRINNFYQEL
jgi:hypothetical protein